MNFHLDLKEAGCDTIKPAAEGRQEWIVATADAGFKKLKEQLRKRADGDGPSFVDAIDGFDEFGAKDKIGKRLAAHPLERNAEEKIFVSLGNVRPDRDEYTPVASLALVKRMAYDRGLAWIS